MVNSRTALSGEVVTDTTRFSFVDRTTYVTVSHQSRNTQKTVNRGQRPGICIKFGKAPACLARLMHSKVPIFLRRRALE